eukprot:gene20728-biopygen16907
MRDVTDPHVKSDETSREPGRLMLLDTASMYFRAFFGVPEITAPDGTPVNAVRGLMDFISRLVDEYQPTHLVCCWDNDWRPQWRVDLIPTYKTHRVVEEVEAAPDVEEVPDPLQVQVPIILEVLDAFGITVIGADGYEADDVIGTLATDAGQPDEDERPATTEELAHGLALARKRGRPAGSGVKEQVAIRLDKDILEAFRAQGQGWQTRINQALRRYLAEHPAQP